MNYWGYEWMYTHRYLWIDRYEYQEWIHGMIGIDEYGIHRMNDNHQDNHGEGEDKTDSIKKDEGDSIVT